MSFDNCRMFMLPSVKDDRGRLTVLEAAKHAGFKIQRVFYLTDVPAGASRGGHALRTCAQIMIAVAGSFDVVLNDGTTTQRVHLDRPNQCLLVPPLIWRDLEDFAPSSICLVLASDPFDEDAYLRSFEAFLHVLEKTDA